MEEEAYHHYGQKVSLKCLKNGKYLSVDLDHACATATGNHPILYVPDLDFHKQEELKVLKFDNRESTGILNFGTALCFQSEDGSYLTFNASGELRVEKNPNYESGNNNIAKLAQWTIIDANNPTNRGPVTQFDDIVLRIPFGSYLMVEDNLLMSANGQAINEETTFKLVKANIPFLPDWLMKRPYLNHNNLVSRKFFDKHIPNYKKKTYEEEPKPIGSFPVEVQETYLIEDLLHCMNSIEGVYIRRQNVESEYDQTTRYIYRVEPYLEQSTCDFSLLYLIGKILPICNNHDRVVEFVSSHSNFEYGQVSQALCGAINALMKEYLLLVTQLDTEFMKGNLTLQKAWLYIQQSLRIMENLNKLAIEATDKKGGALLNVIYKFLTITSDKSIKELFSFLLEKSAEPFLHILMKWIYYGVLDDPFEEFLVKEDTSMNKDNIEKDFNDSYWQK